jgi:hypothetical protein
MPDAAHTSQTHNQPFLLLLLFQQNAVVRLENYTFDVLLEIKAK